MAYSVLHGACRMVLSCFDSIEVILSDYHDTSVIYPRNHAYCHHDHDPDLGMLIMIAASMQGRM